MLQHEQLTGKRATTAWGDRGYRGETLIDGTQIKIHRPLSKKLSRYKQEKEKKSFRRRAAIEPIIGHLKSDHRLSRNYYKGIQGDAVNVLLAAAAFNFKRMLNKWKRSFLSFFFDLLTCFIANNNAISRTFLLTA